MTKMIHKYTLMQAQTRRELPKGFKILGVEEQHETIALWMEVDESKPLEVRDFYLLGTGREVPENCEHIGTVLLEKGMYVFHVYMSQEIVDGGV